MDDKKVITYLTNRKIATNMDLIKLFNGKVEYPNFPTKKLLAQNEKMRRVRKLFDNGFITFDDAVKGIANDSIDDSFYEKYK